MADEGAIANNKAFVLTDNFNSSTDPIRNDLKNYWSTQFGGEETFRILQKYSLDIGDKFGLPTSQVDYEYKSIDLAAAPGGFSKLFITTHIETIGIRAKLPGDHADDSATTADDPNPDILFRDFIENNIVPSEKTVFYDYYFDIAAPIEYISNVDNISLIEGTVDYRYNYGLEKYERAINSAEVKETEIDNFYNFFQVVSQETDVTKYYKRPSEADPLKSEYSIGDYLIKSVSDPSKARTTDYKDFFITQKSYKESTALFQYKDVFPFYNMISFSNPPGTSESDRARDAIFENDFTTAFCDAINIGLSEDAPITQLSYTALERSFTNSYLASSYLDETQQEFKEVYALKDENIKLIDVDILLLALSEAPDISEEDANKYILEDKSGYLDMTGGRSTELKYRVSQIHKRGTSVALAYGVGLSAIKKEIQDLLHSETRSFAQILSGKKPYLSNVMFYRIAKFEFGSTTPIQNFWIPAESIYLGLDYVDTQVKYGKKYEYKIYAYKLMVGSQYSYEQWIINTNVEFLPPVGRFEGQIGDSRKTIQKQIDYVKANRAALEKSTGYTEARSVRDALLSVSIPDWKTNAESLRDKIILFSEGIINDGAAIWTDSAGIEALVPIEAFDNEQILILQEINQKWNNFYPEWFDKISDASDFISSSDFQERVTNAITTIDGGGKATEKSREEISASIIGVADLWAQFLAIQDIFLSFFTDADKNSTFNLIFRPGDQDEAQLVVKTKPSLKFVQIPYYESRGTILDNPPLFPNINFITYRGRDSKLSLFLNSSQGSLEEDPITFSEKEEKYYTLFREARKMNDFQKILFKSDEFENLAAIFEVRRLSTPPKSYEDFKDANTSIITTPYGINHFASAAAFLDNIEPNKKYYYMFRAVDRRGTVSNPTAIYQVELVENSGAIYPLIESYEVAKDSKQTLKSFKRLFNILPRLTQVLPDVSVGSFSVGSFTEKGDIKLGLKEAPLFGKTFKIRLTSKKTGKAVDLNVSFDSTVEHE